MAGTIQKHKIGNYRVTDKELAFLKFYLKKTSKHYMNHMTAGQAVYGEKNIGSGSTLLKRPRIMAIIKDILDHKDYNALIDRGFRKILSNHKDKFFTRTAELVFKVRGDMAPEKVVNVSLTPEELRAERLEIANLLKGNRNGKRIGLTGEEYRSKGAGGFEEIVSEESGEENRNGDFEQGGFGADDSGSDRETS